ncbi:hypothetical protein D7X98_04180 [bacterium 1XD8-76]|nr:hypothetical protein D7X98_04180 [bacterium 1XD8-76]
MAAKLKNLKISKVDFVDEGANPDADIKMTKRKDGEKPSAEADGRKDARSVLKKLFDFIGKAAGMGEDEIDSAVDEIQKGDFVSFHEKVNEMNNRKIADEMWDICYALQSALCSILNDEEIDSTSTATAMQESLDEFYEVVKESISKWSSGKETGIVRKSEEVSETELSIMESAVKRLNASIDKAKDAGKKSKEDENNIEDPKGEEKEMGMKIDKSKLTEAEKAFLESIEKRYGTEEGADPNNGGTGTPGSADQVQTGAAPAVTKSAPTGTGAEPAQQEEGPNDIYKGLHPAVKAELEGLKKFREESEERELKEVAKRYAIIGKKEEELVPLFKSLRAAGGTAYNDMIAVLDQAVAMVEKSGAFSEIGKSGHSSGTMGSAEAKVEAIAKGYMEKDSSLDYASAIAKAWEDNPDLMSEYEEEAGF